MFDDVPSKCKSGKCKYLPHMNNNNNIYSLSMIHDW